jgi:hypothetical protein
LREKDGMRGNSSSKAPPHPALSLKGRGFGVVRLSVLNKFFKKRLSFPRNF